MPQQSHNRTTAGERFLKSESTAHQTLGAAHSCRACQRCSHHRRCRDPSSHVCSVVCEAQVTQQLCADQGHRTITFSLSVFSWLIASASTSGCIRRRFSTTSTCSHPSASGGVSNHACIAAAGCSWLQAPAHGKGPTNQHLDQAAHTQGPLPPVHCSPLPHHRTVRLLLRHQQGPLMGRRGG